jgi:hypothetical protein
LRWARVWRRVPPVFGVSSRATRQRRHARVAKPSVAVTQTHANCEGEPAAEIKPARSRARSTILRLTQSCFRRTQASSLPETNSPCKRVREGSPPGLRTNSAKVLMCTISALAGATSCNPI